MENQTLYHAKKIYLCCLITVGDTMIFFSMFLHTANIYFEIQVSYSIGIFTPCLKSSCRRRAFWIMLCKCFDTQHCQSTGWGAPHFWPWPPPPPNILLPPPSQFHPLPLWHQFLLQVLLQHPLFVVLLQFLWIRPLTFHLLPFLLMLQPLFH